MAEPVDIILLSYNRLDFLVEMVDAIEQRTRWPHRLTIVENASGPATREWLREHTARFHQVIFNDANEHLAGFQRGIAATSSELFVLSDADLIPAEPTAAGCWLERLLGVAERHGDFGLLGVRLDSISDARNVRLERAPLIDAEVFETSTGVWLNLIRRSALRIPYMSDGITCHALRRAGFRVGIAAEVYATHLGDADPARHPDYLARKQSAGGWRTTYPDYPELSASAPPPTLHELALAAPVLAALTRNAIATEDTIELAAAGGVLAAAAPQIAAHAPDDPELRPARAVVVIEAAEADTDGVARAFAHAAEWVLLLASPRIPRSPAGWALVGEHPGPHPVLARLAQLASRPRWRRRLLYSTSEHREQWLAVFRAGCFGEQQPLRVYVFRRTPPLALPAAPEAIGRPPAARPSRRPPRLRRHRIGSLVTKARRLIRAEWQLARHRPGAR